MTVLQAWALLAAAGAVLVIAALVKAAWDEVTR